MKDVEGTVLIIRAEVLLEGDYDLENLATTQIDPMIRKETQDNIKKTGVIEKFGPNSDILYTELTVPFPYENREMLHHRVYFNNKKNPELVEKYGLWKKDDEYFVVLAKSVERSDVPVVKGKTRAETQMMCFVYEKDATNPKLIRMTLWNQFDMKMKIPSLMRGMAAKKIEKDLTTVLDAVYKKHFKK